jgi:hypothetical protein
MRFRWIVFVALWTILSGPIFTPSASAPSQTKPKPAVKTHSGR